MTIWLILLPDDPRDAPTGQIAQHLKEIIEIEGPIRVQRAYRLYAQASGIGRIGRAVRSSLNRALHFLERKREVELERDGADDRQTSATVRITGTPAVVVRNGGHRDFWEVPPSEIAVVLKQEKSSWCEDGDEDELYHRVIARFGHKRLTSNIRAELDRISHKLSETD